MSAMPGSFPQQDEPKKNLLEASNAFKLGGFETINDKVLREMNERARTIVEPQPPQQQFTSRVYSPPSQRKKSLAAQATAAATAARTPKRHGHHKRYSSVHRRQFAKMESISTHHAAQKARTEQYSSNRQVNETELNNDTKKDLGGDKRTSSRVVTNASKRRRMDLSGRKLELRSSNSRTNLAKLAAQQQQQQQHQQQEQLQTGAFEARKTAIPSPLKTSSTHTHISTQAREPLSPCKSVEQMLNRLPPPPARKPPQPKVQSQPKAQPPSQLQSQPKAQPPLSRPQSQQRLRKSPSVASLAKSPSVSNLQRSSRIPTRSANTYAAPTQSSISRLTKARSIVKSSPNLKALASSSSSSSASSRHPPSQSQSQSHSQSHRHA